MKKAFLRTVIEMGFIVFLFYSNLLMGQFTRNSPTRSFLWDVENIFSVQNFVIAVVTAFIGHMIFDYLRKKF